MWQQSPTLLPLSPKENSGVTVWPVSPPPLLSGVAGKTTAEAKKPQHTAA